MVVRETQRIDQGAAVIGGETPVPVRSRQRRSEADTLPQQRYDGVIGQPGSSANGARYSAALQAAQALDGEVRRQRAAARPEIDLSPGSSTMTTMEHIARGAGLDFEALKNDLRDVFSVRSLENIGNVGPARTSKRSNSIDARMAEAVARDIGHDFPDVIRATAKRLASFQGWEKNERGQIPGKIDRQGPSYVGPNETTPAFVKTVWAYHSLYPSSRFFDEELTADPMLKEPSGQKTLRETVNRAVIWSLEKLKTDRSPRYVAAVYDALVYGADLLRQAPGPKGPLEDKSLATADSWEALAKELQTAFLAGFAGERIRNEDVGALLDSRILVSAEADQARSALIGKVVERKKPGSIADEMQLMHGLIRHSEVELATRIADGILEAAAKGAKSASSISAAWASLSWLADRALTGGTYLEVMAGEAPKTPIRVLIGKGDLELSAERRSIGLGVA